MKLDVLKTQETAWYANGLKFTCSQCGNCCTGGPGFVWLSEVEIGRLADYLGMGREEVIEQYCREVHGRFSLKENRNHRGEYDCIFLKEERVERAQGDAGLVQTKRSCMAYPVRPLQCRTWPFWESNLSAPEIWEVASKRCHGMNQGRTFSKAQMEALRDARDWPKDAPTS